DWSSDVCSSDLLVHGQHPRGRPLPARHTQRRHLHCHTRDRRRHHQRRDSRGRVPLGLPHPAPPRRRGRALRLRDRLRPRARRARVVQRRDPPASAARARRQRAIGGNRPRVAASGPPTEETTMMPQVTTGALVALLIAPLQFAGELRVQRGAGEPDALQRIATPQPDFHWRGRIDRGKAIEVRGINGDIRAERATGDAVEVTAVKRGRGSDPERVTIEVVPHGDGVTICAVYPSRDAARPNECRPGGGNGRVRDTGVVVEFVVRVPEGVRLVAATVNGKIEARDLASDAALTTVNGSISVSTTGLARASTVNGSIDAVLGRADWTGALEFNTVNGSITVELPEGLSAELEAATVNGRISTEFPVTVSGRFSPRRFQGTIGDG